MKCYLVSSKASSYNQKKIERDESTLTYVNLANKYASQHYALGGFLHSQLNYFYFNFATVATRGKATRNLVSLNMILSFL